MSKRPYYSDFPLLPANLAADLSRRCGFEKLVSARVGREGSFFLDLSVNNEAGRWISLDQVQKLIDFTATPVEEVFFDASEVEGASLSLTLASSRFNFQPLFDDRDRAAALAAATEGDEEEEEDEGDDIDEEDDVREDEDDEGGGFIVMVGGPFTEDGQDAMRTLPAELGLPDRATAFNDLVQLLGLLEAESQLQRTEDALTALESGLFAADPVIVQALEAEAEEGLAAALPFILSAGGSPEEFAGGRIEDPEDERPDDQCFGGDCAACATGNEVADESSPAEAVQGVGKSFGEFIRALLGGITPKVEGEGERK